MKLMRLAAVHAVAEEVANRLRTAAGAVAILKRLMLWCGGLCAVYFVAHAAAPDKRPLVE